MAKTKADWLAEAEALGVEPLHEDMFIADIRDAIDAKIAVDNTPDPAAESATVEAPKAKLSNEQRVAALEEALTHLLRNEVAMAVEIMGAQR